MKRNHLANFARLVAAAALVFACVAAGLGIRNASAQADASAAVTRRFTLDTSGLVGHAAGPFKLNFQLVDADAARRNSVTVRNVAFGQGGSAGAVERAAGGASGDLGLGVTLNDSALVNDFAQEFTPGDRLSFDLQLTEGGAAAGGRADSFTFAILDRDGSPIPTRSGLGASPEQGDGSDVLIVASFGLPTTVEAFETERTRAPKAGGPAVETGAPEVNQLPVVKARGLVLDAGADGTANVAPDDLDAGSFDPDAGDSVRLSMSPAGPFGVGAHQLSFVVTDSRGGASAAVVTVTVVDRTAPVVNSAPGVQTVSAGEGCRAVVPDLRALVAASDNVTPSAALALTQEPAAGSALGFGEHAIRFVVRDAAGNAATASTALRVADGQAPSVSAALGWAGVVNRTVGTFRVEFAAADGCDAAAQAAAVMELPEAGLQYEAVFERADGDGSRLEIRLDAGRGRAVLRGPDEAAAREQLRQLLADGGARVTAGQQLTLHLMERPASRGHYDQYTYVYSQGALVEMKAPKLTLRASAGDAAGNTATALAAPVFRR
jgi:hypothetical protein